MSCAQQFTLTKWKRYRETKLAPDLRALLNITKMLIATDIMIIFRDDYLLERIQQNTGDIHKNPWSHIINTASILHT